MFWIFEQLVILSKFLIDFLHQSENRMIRHFLTSYSIFSLFSLANKPNFQLKQLFSPHQSWNKTFHHSHHTYLTPHHTSHPNTHQSTPSRTPSPSPMLSTNHHVWSPSSIFVRIQLFDTAQNAQQMSPQFFAFPPAFFPSLRPPPITWRGDGWGEVLGIVVGWPLFPKNPLKRGRLMFYAFFHWFVWEGKLVMLYLFLK